ncbi:hypothetical protein NE573_23500, partial [Parabacteroides distasonis]|nr:hypothetical protein [Parabacteroides distasonis]
NKEKGKVKGLAEGEAEANLENAKKMKGNLQETKPEKWEALKEQFKIPAIKDELGMLTVPLIDAMVREQQWICPIYSKEGNSAYHARGEDNHIVVPLKGQFK